MKTDKLITRSQLMATAFVGVLSPMTRLLPGSPAILAGNAAWLAPAVALPFCVLYFRMLGDMTSMRRDGQGMCELLCEAWGRRLGSAAAVVVALWLVFYSAFTLRNASERILSTVYNYGSTWIFSLLLTVMAVIAARGTLRSLARSAQIFAILGAVILAPLLVMAGADVKTEYLLPVTAYDLPGIALAAIPVINLTCYFGYFTFMYSGVRRLASDEGVTMRWLLAVLVAAFSLIYSTVGCLSAALSVRLQSPFFIMIRNITLFGVAERVEALVLGLWVISDFVFISGQMMIASYIFAKQTAAIKRQHWCLIIGAAGFAGSFLLGSSAFDLRILSQQIVPLSNMAIMLVMIPAAWLTLKIKAAVRTKRQEKKKKA